MKTPATPLDEFANSVEGFFTFIKNPKYAAVFILWTGWTAWQLQTELVWQMFFAFVTSYAGFQALIVIVRFADLKNSKVAGIALAVPWVVFCGVLWVGFYAATVANIFLFAYGILSTFLKPIDAKIGGLLFGAAGILFVAAKFNKMI